MTNAYACGVKDDVLFCIEGTSDGLKYSANQTLLQGADLWNNTCTVFNDEEYGYTECGPWDDSGSLCADAYFRGNVFDGVAYDARCEVDSIGSFGCIES